MNLFHEIMRAAPFQPATNFWRAVELNAIRQLGLPPGRGLDLGCGDGELTRILLHITDHKNCELVGVDLDPLETKHAAATGLYSKVHTTSATAIPEKDSSFDFIFSNSVLEHIKPIDDVLQEVARILKSGGIFILTVPGPGFHACLRGPIFGGDKQHYNEEIDRRCAHLRYWPLETWTDQLAQAGFRIDYSREYLSCRQLRTWERISALTGGLLYRLAGKRQQPIEIQRRFRMRDNPHSMASTVARLLSRLLIHGSTSADDSPGPYACLLIQAVKD